MKRIFALALVMLLVISSLALFFTFADDTGDEFEGGGDLSKLIVPKTTYEYDEPINIKAFGDGKDWVGIYYPDDLYSLQWTYIDEKEDRGVGSGVEFNVRTAGFKGSNSPPDVLPVGEYIIRLQPDDSSNFNITIAWVKIKIVPPADAKAPNKPISATYKLDNKGDGLAAGELNIKLEECENTDHIVAYWGNEKGKLEGYSPLAKIKAESTDVTYKFAEKLMIPNGATKLYLYAANFFDYISEDCLIIDIPENAASEDFGKPIVEFQVVSDIHVVDQSEHVHNSHYLSMLNDIVANSPNSMGIFVVGDMVDYGSAAEYRKLEKIYKSVEGAPKQYFAIGNHDMFTGTEKESVTRFLKYSYLPDGTHPKSMHYDFWLNGYHFVFLGNDKLVGMIDATLNEETLTWLDKTLAKDRDENRPTFLFLHQGLANTVAGTLSGQGWDGIVSGSVMKFKMILRKYPEVIMFNGHSHWELDSERTMYPRTQALPTIFNTSAVAYLTTSYYKMAGDRLEGSEGYYIKVYQDKVVVLGRDFVTGEWKSSAQFYVDFDNGTGPKKNKVTFDTLGVGGGLGPAMVAPNGTLTVIQPDAVSGYKFEGWYTNDKLTEEFDPSTVITEDITLYAKWTQVEVETEEPVLTPETETAAPSTVSPDDGNNGVVTVIICCVAAALVIGGAVVIVIIKRKK